MFKKSLLAAALVLATANASAATVRNIVVAQIDLIGQEFVVTGTAGVTLSTSVITLGAQYSVGDIVKVSVVGAEFDLTNSTQSLAFADVGAGSTMTLGLLSSTANTLTYRVTAATGDHNTDTLTFSGMKLTNASAAAATDISVSYAAETSTGIAIDAATTNTVKVMKTVDQYSTSFAVATDKLDATISVASLRANFGTGVYSDALLVAVNEYAPTGTQVWSAFKGVAPTASKVTLKGDFSFLDTNADGKIDGTDDITTPFVVAGGATAFAIATDMQSVVLTGPVAFTNAGVTITAGNAAGETIIKDQVFTVDTSLTYATAIGNATETASMAAGEWDLDGFTGDIAFLPFGSQYAQSVTITNTGTVVGAITVTLTYDGVEYTKTLSAVAAANSVTNISLELAAFAAESGVVGNAGVNVVVNATTANIALKGVYYHKADGDRVLTK